MDFLLPIGRAPHRPDTQNRNDNREPRPIRALAIIQHTQFALSIAQILVLCKFVLHVFAAELDRIGAWPSILRRWDGFTVGITDYEGK
jgi:hypothetical protein